MLSGIVTTQDWLLAINWSLDQVPGGVPKSDGQSVSKSHTGTRASELDGTLSSFDLTRVTLLPNGTLTTVNQSTSVNLEEFQGCLISVGAAA